ncbi:hypothetical protein PRIPAC_87605 [Pristionchus pacificus]|uniref:Uncharacterized protein n=1 Tax=Pristionchus pacificus TaxID=54126 RepID=A0A2A6BZ79_PRIPA|nr:hypothetical protein PRIPAC_87605 [Pristionchus pacificus]|eukprot:PDM71200.1 hypothetical protein PRIPAC_43583 [Pristionchus pacificus]
MLLFLLLSFLNLSNCQSEVDEYRERKAFHRYFCRRHPSSVSCTKPYTIETFEREKDSHLESSTSSRWNDEDDDDYEMRLWGKYRRIKEEREEWSREKDVKEIHIHHHNDSPPPLPPPPPPRPYYPRQYYYPSQSYYPSYGGGYGCCNYGYGGGGIFNFGLNRGLGIGWPGGGFGLGSSFSIGVG